MGQIIKAYKGNCKRNLTTYFFNWNNLWSKVGSLKWKKFLLIAEPILCFDFSFIAFLWIESKLSNNNNNNNNKNNKCIKNWNEIILLPKLRCVYHSLVHCWSDYQSFPNLGWKQHNFFWKSMCKNLGFNLELNWNRDRLDLFAIPEVDYKRVDLCCKWSFRTEINGRFNPTFVITKFV